MLLLLAFSAGGDAATVRNDFVNRVYSNNGGTVNWNGDWVEVDENGGGPTGGNETFRLSYVEIDFTVVLSGTGPVDTDTVVITDPIPANMALRVIDFDGVTTGPVQFVDGAPLSGLTFIFVALGDAGDDVSFSNDGGTTFTYAPTADANGVDLTVTHIRIDPKSDFLGNTGSVDPSFEVYFKAIAQWSRVLTRKQARLSSRFNIRLLGKKSIYQLELRKQITININHE